jgi:hypothetical protein
MQHRSAVAEDGCLAGGWWIEEAHQERRFCSWTFDLETGDMRVSRGLVTRPWHIPTAEQLSLDELRDRLPKVALFVAGQIRA